MSSDQDSKLCRNLKPIVTMLESSSKIQDSSSCMMNFMVEDLLDFAQINAGKFRKVIQEFDLREAVQEMVDI